MIFRKRELTSLNNLHTFQDSSNAQTNSARAKSTYLPFLIGLLGLPLFYYGPRMGFFGCVLFAYVGFAFSQVKNSTKSSDAKIKHDLPIFIEGLILLVESGLGILPAISRTIESRELCNSSGKIDEVFKEVYKLVERGIPLENAFQQVAAEVKILPLKHTLLHIDISSTTGGELTPALRALSEYTFIEWKNSVETRIKQLENLVVFPVFCSVIGLMFLVSAVPLMPLLDLKDTLKMNKENMAKVNDNFKSSNEKFNQ